MERTIKTPDWEWGTDEQMARWLGIDIKIFESMVVAGTIPPGARWSRQTEYWNWFTAVGISALLPFLMAQASENRQTRRRTKTATVRRTRGEVDETGGEVPRTGG